MVINLCAAFFNAPLELDQYRQYLPSPGGKKSATTGLTIRSAPSGYHQFSLYVVTGNHTCLDVSSPFLKTTLLQEDTARIKGDSNAPRAVINNEKPFFAFFQKILFMNKS